MTLSVIQFRYTVTADVATVRPYVDSEDLLAGYQNSAGLDPERILPPLSDHLLPTRAGRTVIIGSCTCGETGCGCLVVHIRRVGTEVCWGPSDEAGYSETLARSYRFGLVDYLDAVDRAADDRPGEGRGARVARLVRLSRRGFERRYDPLPFIYRVNVDWIGAWPLSSDVVGVSVTRDGEQSVHEFGPGPRESDGDFAARVAGQLHQLCLPGADGGASGDEVGGRR